jgi:hypothetical protein
VVIGGWTTTSGRFRSLLVGVNRGDPFVYKNKRYLGPPTPFVRVARQRGMSEVFCIYKGLAFARLVVLLWNE